MKSSSATPDPTPAEIAAACERIRAGWSESETRRRSAWAECEAWTAPTIEIDEDGDREP
jgi:hypothetical protein